MAAASAGDHKLHTTPKGTAAAYDDDVIIRIRCSALDYKMERDPSPFDHRVSPYLPAGERLDAVPVLRIFGATDQGQRVVAHVHGAFPYVYVEYQGSLNPDTVNGYMYKLGLALNRALDLSQRRFEDKKKRTPQYIAFILLCKAVPIYGYQVGYKTYLKIYYVNPRHKKALGALLQGGAIMGTRFEVYEEHLNFTLQFMLDANLYGSGWVEVSNKCRFRNPLPDEQPTSTMYTGPPTCTGPYGTRTYTTLSVPSSLLHSSAGPTKETYCPVELDLPLSAIHNRRRVTGRDLHHDFVEMNDPGSFETGKLVKSLKELWIDEERRRNARGEEGPKDVEDADPRMWDERGEKEPVWAVEPELREKIEALAATSLKDYQTKMGSYRVPDFKSYVGDLAKMKGVEQGFLNRIRTSFEQVEGLFEEKMMQDEEEGYEYGAWAVKGIGLDVKMEAQRARLAQQAEQGVDRDQMLRTQAAFAKLFERRDEEGSDYSNASSGDDGESVRALSEAPSDAFDHLDDDDFSDTETDAGVGGQYQREASEALAGESASPSRGRSATVELGDADFEEPEPKRFKRDESSPAAPPLSNPLAPMDDFTAAVDFAASFRAPPASQKLRTPTRARRPSHNPFVSPDKALKSRRATTSSSSPLPPPRMDSDEEDLDGPGLLAMRDEPDELEAPSSDTITPDDVEMAPAGPQPPQQVEMEAALDLEDLEQLSASAFEYQPTPTQVDDSAPDDLPLHLRSHVKVASEDQPLPSFESSGSSSLSLGGEGQHEAPAASTSSAEPRQPTPVDPAPTRRRVTFQVSEVKTDSDADADDWSDSSNPVERLPATQVSQASQPSATSTTSSVPAIALRPNCHPLSRHAFTFAIPPPTVAEVLAAMEPNNQPALVYQDPYFSVPLDIPNGKRAQVFEYGGRTHKVRDTTLRNLPPFHATEEDGTGVRAGTREEGEKESRRQRCRSWQYAPRPPSGKEVAAWLAAERNAAGLTGEEERKRKLQQGRNIEAPTQKNGGFQFTPINGAMSQKEPQHMAVLTMELHTSSRGKLLPDPKEDEILILFYCLKTENEGIDFNGRSEDTHVGVIAVAPKDEEGNVIADIKAIVGATDYVLDVVETEHDLINEWIDRVREWDPECVGGYEIHKGSWGYLIERAHYAHEWDITPDFGRVSRNDQSKHGDRKSDRWGFTQSTTISFTGRHVLPVWRILKADNRLQANSFEHAVFHVLQQRTPHFSFETLTKWYNSGVPHKIARVFEYWRNRVEMDVEMLDAAEVVERNCEEARVYGVDFKSVRTRGSQFKVEAVLFKLSKPESFMMLSPTREDVGRQNAAECQPLIMEPQSAFYKGPLVVLDFTSLYPSVVIAHNYCWSTCLGRVDSFKGSAKLGTSTLEHPPGLIYLLKDHITVSPNGMMFVKPHIRKSLMAKMVSELLDTRAMVKTSMKAVSDDRALTKLLNARQLALKLLANVTYGYIGATFSGRMPCVEVADAIVQTGRETLENALRTIESRRADWGATVVYGDTDSLFVYLPGKSKEDAFRIGNEMADTVTSMNPRPMRLKFEKVYLPCVLVAKKRYVGFKYERLSDAEPEFEAKGIEVIRRDGIPALQKMQEACIKTLFRSADISQVKQYVQRQWTKILAGDVSPRDFIFAKKVKLGSYAEGRAPPPGAAVAARAMELDPRGEPEFGERVPYVLMQAEPGTKQVDRALDPHAFLADSRLRLDAEHYIVKTMLKPLARIFNLAGVNIDRWWKETRKTRRLIKARGGEHVAKALLEEHFESDRCRVCDGPEGEGGICATCKANPGQVAYSVMHRLRRAQGKQRALHEICASCSATRYEEGIECDSLDCSVLFDRVAAGREVDEVEGLQKFLDW